MTAFLEQLGECIGLGFIRGLLGERKARTVPRRFPTRRPRQRPARTVSEPRRRTLAVVKAAPPGPRDRGRMVCPSCKQPDRTVYEVDGELKCRECIRTDAEGED